MLINKFTAAELNRLQQCKSQSHGSRYLSSLGKGFISPQLAGQWMRKLRSNSIKVPTHPVSTRRTGLKIIVVADTQCKPTEDLEYMRWIGQYINEKKPDVVVHIGDNWDCPSLSSYDKGKKSFEGRRLIADLKAGADGLRLLTEAATKDGHRPRLAFCMGNHEERIDRLADNLPELDGFVGTEFLPLAELGWEAHPFLKPVEIGGIFFVHYLANPFSGKPYGGSALNQLKHVGKSFVVGHKQCLDIAMRYTLDGKQQIGIVNGACYPFEEAYKGWQGNSHFRGITVLHEVKDGGALPMFVSLNYLQERFQNESI